MTMLPIILIGVVTLAMCVLYAIFQDMGEWQGFIVRSLTGLFLLIYAVITINLTSIINAFSLFITIALAIFMFYEGLQTSKISNLQAKTMLSGISKALIYLSVALGIMSLAEFNWLALVGGLLLGVGLGLMIWAIKKYKNASNFLSTVFIFIALGLGVGFGINSIFTTRHLISAIIAVVSMALMLLSEFLAHFLKEGKANSITSSTLRNIALIMLVISIYLFS